MPNLIFGTHRKHINRAAVIIAELTYKNPNVFYELGMAHVLGKDVILISQSEEVIPFDLRGVRQILYQDKPSGYEKLAVDIKRYVDSVLKERKKHAAAAQVTGAPPSLRKKPSSSG
jgi:hypothetical protein